MTTPIDHPTPASDLIKWDDLETILWDRFSAACTSRHGRTRGYTILTQRSYHRRSPTKTIDWPGYLRVEVTLNPRWCMVAVDRWHTTDRDGDIAGPWFEEHVWPHVHEACNRKRTGSGTLPSGNPTYAHAYPIDRDVLPEVLVSWITAELEWTNNAKATA